MTKAEALLALRQGKKITHIYFSDEEWMRIKLDPETKEEILVFEDNVETTLPEFFELRVGPHWEDGYSEWEESGDLSERIID